jgi:iron complex outermembrane receptor protein
LAIKEQCTPTKPSLLTKTSLTFSGNITVNYKATDKINSATYAKSYKPVGVNVAGLPTPAAGQTLADLVIRPEV